MSLERTEQIVIRHLSGSKANQIEHISLAGLAEITIGRDPKSQIAFDSSRDDIVSRRHAVIRVAEGEQISFRLADLGSNNGTFLNGERIEQEAELLPEDVVELGKNGVKFVFDVQPRPANLVARTRVIDISGAAATRIVQTAGFAAHEAAQDMVSKAALDVAPAAPRYEEPPKPGVGKETLLHMLGEERRATRGMWASSLAGLAAFLALGGGVFYWKQHQREARLQEEMAGREQSLESRVSEQQADIEKKTTDLEKKTAEGRGLTPQDIVVQFGNATAQIERHWRLYDQTTGQPIFHLTVSDRQKSSDKKKTLPAYVQLGNRIVRWLTLEHENRSNIAIEGRARGTGFAVSEQGFILTNKHVAAAWKLGFGQEDPANDDDHDGYGWLYEYKGGPGAGESKLKSPKLINLNDSDYESLKDWVPASGGLVFRKDVAIPIGEEGNIPDPSKGEQRTFFGRNDVLEVRFANSRGSASANLVRSSNESDAALIKVDTPQQLKKLDIAADDAVTVGEPVIAMGFPSVATKTIAVSSTIENGQYRQNIDEVPQPYVSEGIVSVISPAVKTENGVTVGGAMGDLIQMSINSTGAGNSGGPVFNKAGKVIGLFTYRRSVGGVATTEAIPIKYGRELLLAQHP